MNRAKFLTHEERLALTRGTFRIQKPREVETVKKFDPNDESRWDFRRTNRCPLCGAELIHVSGCVNCSECEWSAC